MKLRAVVNLENQNNQCQFGIEIELDENSELDEIQEKTNKATAALKMAINSVVNIKALNENQTSQKPKQLLTDQATPKQKMFLESLLKQNNYTTKRWCKEQGVSENEITAAHCKEWIPELTQRIKEKMNDDEKFFLS